MPTTPTIPARIHASRLIHAFRTVSAKEVLFVLNGRGKFHRELINPMKMPTLDQLLEECSTRLEIAIHRLYTPQGKLITTVEEILSYDGLKIIACPRNERPYLNENSTKEKLPQILPKRYAPREAYSISEKKSSTGGSDPATSGNSSGNSIEKRQPLPSINNRYVSRRPQENGVSNSTTTTSPYVPKSYASKLKQTVPPTTKLNNKTTSKEVNKKPKKDTAMSSAESNKTKDSGKGTSLNNSQQSERHEKMTEKKAQMIREELRTNLKQQNHQNSSSDQYSEEDLIREAESDFEHDATGIQSGTSDEEEEEAATSNATSAAESAKKRSAHSSHRTPAQKTPSTSESDRLPSLSKSKMNQKQRRKTMSRQDTPYQATPSRQTTAATEASRLSTSGSSEPHSRYSSRPTTSSTAVREVSDDEDEDEKHDMMNGTIDEEDSGNEEVDDDDDESLRETPAIHTPDTRLPTSTSRKSTAGSARSFASESSRAWSRISGYSDKEQILPSDEEEDPYRDIGTAERERLGEAATKIQAAYKGYTVRKKHVQFLKEKERKEQEILDYEKQFIHYTFEVMLGNRFGLDFDTPLFFVLHGENGSSEKIYTQADDWLFLPSSCYDPESWILSSTRSLKLGVLTSIDVGHEQEGYGAGTFIDKIVITEDEKGAKECRRFYFQVEKWFDSGQVDGLIVRNIKVNSFLYLVSSTERGEGVVERKKETKGRWEFRLHTLNSDLGGTTSHLKIIGYGDENWLADDIPNDSLLRDPSQVPRIQVDFGNIGRLQKVRFEIQPAGDQPNYYLEYVEAQDLDTRERCVLMVNNWLLKEATPGYRKFQSFREIAIFSNNYYPASIRTFEGTVTFGDKSLIPPGDSPIILQLISQGKNHDDIPLDSSGYFPIVGTKMKNGTTSYGYKVELVTLDSLPRIRILPNVTDLGKDILDGLHLLKGVFDNMGDKGFLKEEDISVGEQLFIEEIVQKSGDHYPYVCTYIKSTIDVEENLSRGPFMKQIKPSKHSGASSISTAKKLKKGEKKVVQETVNWQLTMSLEKSANHHHPIIPTVVLVTRDRQIFEMECEMETPEPRGSMMFLRYTLTTTNFGNPFKVRLSSEEDGPDVETHVHKMMLNELESKTCVFFKVSWELQAFETIEQECTYPDVGDNGSRDYEVHIRTLEGGGNFRPYINIIGDNGDTGHRPYAGVIDFNPENAMIMESIGAINLKELRNIEVWAKIGEPMNWKGNITIVTSDEKIYESEDLELSKNGQIALSPLIFVGVNEPVIDGESYI
ncbi:Doublecortin domain-containing protein [Caenorhabditis elegans]|uniref:Doublecortin domain-containing protein n=1 Tax=Caenorhabditis elegans TaxID=6239 RepID=A0A5K1IAB7_CAEEL|nr:Doublecortin domain-containing protein [Caenorhabditis elegans]VWL57837.1 Doublecortin domain-containing protein [Caenorhabditis elegans]